MKFSCSAFLLAALLLAGCGNGDRDVSNSAAGTDASTNAGATPAPRAAVPGDHFLDRVDAEPVFVYANLERLADDVVDQAWQLNEASLSSVQAALEQLAEDDEVPQPVRALLTRAVGLVERDGWEAAGLHVNPMYALHTAALFPFLEMEIADDRAFASFIGEIEQDLEQPLNRRDVDGQDIIWLEIGQNIGFAMRHGDGSLTAAVVPDMPDLLARVAGKVSPVDAMQPQALIELNREHGFAPAGSGYLDWQRLVALLMSADSPLLALSEDEDFRSTIENPACIAEYRAIAAALPRLSMGYTRLTTTDQDFLLRQKLSMPYAGDLGPVARAAFQTDRPLQGIFNFGLAFDLLAAREFARKLVRGWVDNPPTCPNLNNIAEGAPSWQQALNQPIPPMVTNLHGLFVEADSLELGPSGMPTGGGILAFYMNNPQLLVGMAQMFSPAAAELQLAPGGEAQKVPENAIPQLQGMGLDLWMAMGQSALGVAIGDEHAESMRQALTLTDSDDLLFSTRLNFEALMQIMDLAEDALGDLADEEQLEGLQTQRAQYQALAEIYEQMAFKIRLGEQGIDLISENRLR